MHSRITLPGMLAAIALVAAAPAAWAAASAPAHAHAHGAQSEAHAPEAGKKWATDEPLRRGMTAIREAVEAALPAAHRGRLKPAQYAALGKTVETEVTGIVQQCKLEPAADAALHGVIAQLMEGSDIVQGKDAKAARSEGVVKMAQALERYGADFDHPGWKAVAARH